MLVSHLHKFVYIKNKKVAGTSVESFFGKYCCYPSKDYKYGYTQESISSFGIISRRLEHFPKQRDFKIKLRPHLQAEEIKKLISEDVFNKYFKFCVVRNPWDVIISYYYWHKSLFKEISIKKIIKSKKCYNWDIYTIDDKPICDFFIRFENLKEDVKKVCDVINIKYDPKKLIKMNSNLRPNKNYKLYYDDKLKEFVYEVYKKEIEFFNYKF